MKKVELLAPAGNYEALRGALFAGADAVYLGGNAFSARAYADNFAQQEICDGIRYAHTFNRKIYLTVNTLVKEKEFPALYEFLLPFYEAGLDGAIVQDLGALSFIRSHFPGLALHASTQMTITGSCGAFLLKEEGICRVVPARELSLEEIKEMKRNTGVEVETFVHGAMCYCYSGQCLFSSILGKRSGNRGRCAQPCRLPYRINNGREEYPLSMKDMCTIRILPELIKAGIDSFKIEGRMKKPEYAAGVTAIYRKYIDRCYEHMQDPAWEYKVAKEDMEQLEALYIRSARSEGYYHQYNGKNMITLSSPAYSGSSRELLENIRIKYLDKNLEKPVSLKASFKAGANAYLSLKSENTEACIEGCMVQKAVKQPLSKDKIEEQLLKSGGTCFTVTSVELASDKDIFMPVSAVNQLRRDGLKLLQDRILRKNGLSYEERKAVPYRKNENTKIPEPGNGRPVIHVLVNSKEQLLAAITAGAGRVYIDKLQINEEILNVLTSYKEKKHFQVYLAFPYIVRMHNDKLMDNLCRLLDTPVFDGALVRNLETIGFLKRKGIGKPVVSDSNLYVWNSYAYADMMKKVNEVYFPAELNRHELKELQDAVYGGSVPVSAVVYGKIPLMISAGCLLKTTGGCKKMPGFQVLSDRYQKQFPVYNDCTSCYNIIYNSVPLSLHKMFDGENNLSPVNCRLDFTTEDQSETGRIIEYFKRLSTGQYDEPFYKEYTTGHYKRGVE